MATTISITVGAVTESITVQDDVKASAILQAFYESMGMGDVDATPRQRLAAVVRWVAKTIQDRALMHGSDAAVSAARAAAKEQYEWYKEPETPRGEIQI